MKDEEIISNEDGKILVKYARKIVTEFLKDGRNLIFPKDFQEKFSFKSGIFVTLNNSLGLRGCIGYPLPNEKLYNALRDASIAAATEDPRFSSLKFEELNSITFEVTILSPPEKIVVVTPNEYPSKIKVGFDGLIIKSGNNSGLLLPQVPVEYGWNEIEFLEYTCEKAGLSKDCWKFPETEIKKFRGVVFKEKEPFGEIFKEKLLD